MTERLEPQLERWMSAGVIDAATANRIRAFEATQGGGLRWPVLLALACGALMSGAGVLLFVSSHWDELSTTGRMTVVLLLVSVFHVGALAVRDHFESMAVTLHALGTVALGAGIYLTGQIFHLETGWSGGAMLWSAGAALAWFLVRQWPQAALVAILVPLWLTGEWSQLTPASGQVVGAGWTMLAFTYISARLGQKDDAVRSSLVWIGSFALFPSVVLTCFREGHSPASYRWMAILIAVVASLALALALRGRAAVYNVGAIVWTLILLMIDSRLEALPVHAWFALGAIGLAAWGILEGRAERVNLGVAGFAAAVLLFYFSTVMDKIGRSASLLGLGVLFLAGGYGLERLRRRLVGRIAGVTE